MKRDISRVERKIQMGNEILPAKNSFQLNSSSARIFKRVLSSENLMQKNKNTLIRLKGHLKNTFCILPIQRDHEN